MVFLWILADNSIFKTKYEIEGNCTDVLGNLCYLPFKKITWYTQSRVLMLLSMTRKCFYFYGVYKCLYLQLFMGH